MELLLKWVPPSEATGGRLLSGGGSRRHLHSDVKPVMEPTLPTVCQSCAGVIPVRHRWLGAVAECPHCLRATIPVMMPGTAYPPTEYALSYRDFVQLLGSGDHAVSRFLADSYGYSLAASEGGPRVVNERQEAIDISWLHERIQEDVTRRREIYDIAMSLWR